MDNSIIISETHFKKRAKVPVGFMLIGRSKPFYLKQFEEVLHMYINRFLQYGY